MKNVQSKPSPKLDFNYWFVHMSFINKIHVQMDRHVQMYIDMDMDILYHRMPITKRKALPLMTLPKPTFPIFMLDSYNFSTNRIIIGVEKWESIISWGGGGWDMSNGFIKGLAVTTNGAGRRGPGVLVEKALSAQHHLWLQLDP